MVRVWSGYVRKLASGESKRKPELLRHHSWGSYSDSLNESTAMDTLFNLLPRLFNNNNRNRNDTEDLGTASSYGAFKPTFFPAFRPPRNDEEAQR